MKKYLIILGILEIAFPAIALRTLKSILELQNTVGTSYIVPLIGFLFFLLALIVALAQIVIGLFSLDIKLGKPKTKALIIVGLILAVLTIPAIIPFVIMPTYSIVDEAGRQNPYYSQ